MSEQGPDPSSEKEFHAPSGDPTEVAGPPTEPLPATLEGPHYHEVGSAAGEIVSMGVDHTRTALDGLRKQAADRHTERADAHAHSEAVHQQVAVSAQNRRAGRDSAEGTSKELAPRTFTQRHRAAFANHHESRAIFVRSGPQVRKEQIWGDRIRKMDYDEFMADMRRERPGFLGLLERHRASAAKKKYDADNRYVDRQYQAIDNAAYAGGIIGRVRGFLARKHQRHAEALGGTQPVTRATEDERRQAIANYRARTSGVEPAKNQDEDEDKIDPLFADIRAREKVRVDGLDDLEVWKKERDAEMARIAATPSYIHSYDHPVRPPDYPEPKPGYGPEGITLENVHRLTEEIEQATHEAAERRVNEILTDVRDGKLSEEDQARMLVQDGETWRLAPIEAYMLSEKVENRKLARFLNVAVPEIGQPDSIARREELQVRNLMKKLNDIKRGERGPRRERTQREELQPVYLSPEVMSQYAEHLDPERLDNIIADMIEYNKIQNAHAARRDEFLKENKMNLLVKKGKENRYNLVQGEAMKVIYEVLDKEIAEDLGITVEELNQPNAPTKDIQAYLRYELMRRMEEARQNQTETTKETE